MECPSCGTTLARGATFCASCGDQIPAGFTGALPGGPRRTTALAAADDNEIAIPPTQAIGPDLIPGKPAAICVRCGSAVNPSARFCSVCGRPVVPTAIDKTLDATRSAAHRGFKAFRNYLSKTMKALAQSKLAWSSVIPLFISILLGAYALVNYLFFTPGAESPVSPITRLNGQVSVLVWLGFSLLFALIGILLKR